ncbi:hypothetical protein [Candidatus Lokiarchaeum ossiferum]|uniref:hypothetical protein n=1 Tax=Candidatus Lokiarchaeum ossiferum TaxID=2951803 RepID=UPI00352C5F13
MVQFSPVYASPQDLLRILQESFPSIDPMRIDPHKKKNNYPYNYYHSYPHFLRYFSDLREISIHNFYISTNFIYGWMPTILSYSILEIPKTVELLNLVKHGVPLSPDQIGIIVRTIHNSLVGTSKLLHFINPTQYAMWDSNICLQFYGEATEKIKTSIAAYEIYVAFLKHTQECEGFKAFLSTYRIHFHDPEALPLRALENCLFHLGKSSKTT